MDAFKERIARCLNWPLADVNSLSLPSLRELVRPVSPRLADEISLVIRLGSHVAVPAVVQLSREASYCCLCEASIGYCYGLDGFDGYVDACFAHAPRAIEDAIEAGSMKPAGRTL